MNLVGFVPVFLGVLARRSTDWATSHHGYSAAKSSLHLTALTSVFIIQLTFVVWHYYRLQFATDRLWLATVVIIWPISTTYRCICIIFVQSWPDISALHSPGGSACDPMHTERRLMHSVKSPEVLHFRPKVVLDIFFFDQTATDYTLWDWH